MEHLDHPSFELWESRREWFDATGERLQGEGAYLVSEQACALTADVQAAFCAGAWIAVLVLTMAVVDASLRETELPDFKGDTKRLIESAEANPELQSLRTRRNRLVHWEEGRTAVDVDTQCGKRNELEAEARKAVELMFEAMFIGPWT